MNHQGLKEAVTHGRYEWRRHTLERLAERGLAQGDIIEVLMEGEEIEDYPDDTPYSSALFFAKVLDSPLHVVAAFDDENDWAYIITAYVPDREHFEEDNKTRRKP